MLRRRDLLALAPFALGAGGLLVPRRLLAAPPAPGARKFLFIYAYGGWDTSMVFTPMFDNPLVDTEPDATTASVNGVTFVDSAQRPNVRQFFEQWGDRACVANGMEVRSVTHERCQRILLTGSSESGKDDWAAIMAGLSTEDLLLPHLVVSGPSFTSEFSSRVVRIGDNGQLNALLDGSALANSTTAVPSPSSAADSLADAFVRDRLTMFGAAAGAGRAATFADRYQDALSDVAALDGLRLDLDPDAGGCSRDIASDAASALDAFELGIARCAITRHDGWCAVGWDTHTNNNLQSLHYDELFGFLSDTLADLESRTSASGGRLRDEVTIVVLSEMGRHPQINSGGGRDHWTFTSCMLIGAGVRGGQSIGKLDSNALGTPIDLATGELDTGGESLLPGHLGATLLHLAGIDPAEWVTQGAPILAAVEG
ncbi:MAG: DUF1501 domain-containing protein [Pseudomonadota bacterium]|nr:DUF1501 domain-containing protein [Pseudomonadota bacterium]